MKNHIFFYQMFWKDNLSKNIALEYDLSCIMREDDIPLPNPKKVKMIFSQKIHLKMISGITEKDDIHPRKDGFRF